MLTLPPYLFRWRGHEREQGKRHLAERRAAACARAVRSRSSV